MRICAADAQQRYQRKEATDKKTIYFTKKINQNEQKERKKMKNKNNNKEDDPNGFTREMW